ncbi:MAG: cation diffusion facilitator family transporter [Candidatus Nanopelagicales bacterium]|jgi:cation diffusion facilitator family transporter|nr:cation diffusion facilitator family transporter [Candidatus Nanopelagicales bacterium]MDP4666531.1 cation diffusion facilitator family transporter [Candidatus Nanopelagicales bacterium]MDP4896120.1 cation diffusion facilitator family transporter [Candidatus Nanopelagicales bacterium]
MSVNQNSEIRVNLQKFAWLSIVVSVIVFSMKLAAWSITGSVGLLSDALESTVNIVAAVVALIAIRAAMKPADEIHHFGRGKAEYFSAQIEGFMILFAALIIVYTAIERIINPRELESIGWGLTISTVAAVINGGTAMILLRTGKQHRSPALVADGKHLLTDVWTSVGVIVGVGLVVITGWQRLDGVVALAVGLNIVVTGVRLLRASTAGLMDKALPDEDHLKIVEVLQRHESETVKFHALQTREAGRERFVSMHVLVPGDWSIQKGHDLSEVIEAEIKALLEHTTVSTHVEPLEDARSWADEPEGQHRWI